MVEEVEFNADQNVITKRLLSIDVDLKIEPFKEFRKTYENGRLKIVTYPAEVDGQNPFELLHTYNKLGQLVGLGTVKNRFKFAKFFYNSILLESEELFMDNGQSFVRHFKYNSPGYLEKISDQFLTQNIFYTDGGYGQKGFGDGTVMQTKFNATWVKSSDPRIFKINFDDFPESSSCLRALKKFGYINSSGFAVKSFIPDTDFRMPLICGGSRGVELSNLIAKLLKPEVYGHSYTIGNHREMLNAKFFTDDLPQPLQYDTFFREISTVTLQQSQEIWNKLVDGGFIISNQSKKDWKTAHGKCGKSILRDEELEKDLQELEGKFGNDFDSIKKLIIDAIAKQKVLEISEFEVIFQGWRGENRNIGHTFAAKKLFQHLKNRQHLPSGNFLLSLHKSFKDLLRNYVNIFSEIVNVLDKYCDASLGNHPFDAESYAIDANGNHHHFNSGFNRFKLRYQQHTNKISSIEVNSFYSLEDSTDFLMIHEDNGNTVKAMHRGIVAITYNAVSQRTASIELENGTLLKFYYDAKGGRILKRVFDDTGKVFREAFYTRDENGRVLMDLQHKRHRYNALYLRSARHDRFCP